METNYNKTMYMYSTDNYKVSSIEEIIDNIQNLKITDIYLDKPSYYRLQENNVVRFLDTDFNHPIVLQKTGDWYFLSINPDWYLQNQELVNYLISFVSANNLVNELNISSSCLITSDVIDSLCKNKNLKKVNLSKYEEKGYVLKFDDYLKFKNSNITQVDSKSVDKELHGIYDQIISYNWNKKLIDHYTYEDLSTGKKKFIYLYKELTIEELENLKYIHPNTNIELNDDLCLNFQQIQNKLKELKKDNKIILKLSNKQKFNEFIFNTKIDETNLFVNWDNSELPVLEYLKFEKLLYQLVEPAKNLSPFERYIYAYNITKQFKEYKENNEDLLSARRLYSILVNEFMVCVGYSTMFGDLLDKLGIVNMDYHVDVEVSYDNVKNFKEFVPEEISMKKGGHARRYIHIKDPKYNIDGFYIADPTWDNHLTKDFYNHLALTDSEVTNSRRYSYVSNGNNMTEVFNINSLEEFYEKLNYFVKRIDYLDVKRSKKRVILSLIETLEKIDIKFINNLRSKYEFIDEYRWPDNILELVDEIGNYILKYVNKPISGDTIMKAVEEVYRHSYGYKEEDLHSKLSEVRLYNQKRQNFSFPKRYKEYEDVRKEIYDNEINKFEIEDIPNKII